MASAIQNILGLPYVQFEQQFVVWLEDWEDPERAEVSPYIETLDGVLASTDAISQRRANEMRRTVPRIQRIPLKRTLHSDAQTLEDELREVTPPISLAGPPSGNLGLSGEVRPVAGPGAGTRGDGGGTPKGLKPTT